jgi:hypothetical protein
MKFKQSHHVACDCHCKRKETAKSISRSRSSLSPWLRSPPPCPPLPHPLSHLQHLPPLAIFFPQAVRHTLELSTPQAVDLAINPRALHHLQTACLRAKRTLPSTPRARQEDSQAQCLTQPTKYYEHQQFDSNGEQPGGGVVQEGCGGYKLTDIN